MYEVSRTPEAEAAALTACREFAGYLRDLAARREAAPRDDLISHLVAVRDGTDRLSADELVASAILLLNAGHEASVNALGGGVVALLRHPAQLSRVRNDRALVPSAAEEMIRYDPPLHMFVRTAAAPVTVAGVRIGAGERIAALLGAANRDPAVFAEPDTFDVARDPNPHLGFGAGLHFCLGAPLARIELQAGLAALLDHAPGMALAAEPVNRPTFVPPRSTTSILVLSGVRTSSAASKRFEFKLTIRSSLQLCSAVAIVLAGIQSCRPAERYMALRWQRCQPRRTDLPGTARVVIAWTSATA